MDVEQNPWQTLQSQLKYENPWISVTEHQVIHPSGNPGIYGTVHFKSKALGIIPLDEHLNTYLVGQYRYALREYSWEIPMGGGKLDIDILTSAQRELKEETGLIAAKWTNIARIHTSNSVTDEEGFVFLAEELTQAETEFEETEQLQIKKLPLTEALAMVMRNEITDAISVAGLLKLKLLLAAQGVVV
ncbi:MAG TPA: DNA mismatch repair protein MutT [Microscillaceae bacterium]|nr:DNA mismatch repair protein MutT [Microscillaceae bacterium]